MPYENLSGLDPIDPWAIFRVNISKVKRLVPPRIHMELGEPTLKQRGIESAR